MSTWQPLGTIKRYDAKRPEVGDVVAWKYAAWTVMWVRVDEPTGADAERLRGYRAEFRDRAMPYSLTLRRLHGPKIECENSRQEIGLGVRAASHYNWERYKSGRVPLCSCCGHPFPCRIADQEAQAAREMEAAERELSLMPGFCPACREPVTSRQKSITFGGPNVRNPLAEGPTFHLRRKCCHEAARYEDAWVAAEPGRSRSLLTLRCAGSLIVHGDGSAECFGAEDSDCPSVYARHRGYSACYLQSHGCPRACSMVGHPGTRVSGRPSDPRAIHQGDDLLTHPTSPSASRDESEES